MMDRAPGDAVLLPAEALDREREEDAVGERRREPVREPEVRVRLCQRRRHVLEPRREHHRPRDEAAAAEHDVRPAPRDDSAAGDRCADRSRQSRQELEPRPAWEARDAKGVELVARLRHEPRLGMRHDLYEAEHEDFRTMVRGLGGEERRALPRPVGEGRHRAPRASGSPAAKQGLLGIDVEEQYGGGGVRDFRYNAVLDEELIAHRRQRRRLRRCTTTSSAPTCATSPPRSRSSAGCRASASGELITAIAMTEPGAGSDLQGIQTTARKDGDDWVLNGSKTFITNGINCRPGHRRRQDRPGGRGREGHQPARRRARTCPASAAAATSTRSGSRRRTPPSCSSTTSACRPRTCSAARTGASST